MARTIGATATPPAPDAFPGRMLTETNGLEACRVALVAGYELLIEQVHQAHGSPLMQDSTDEHAYVAHDGYAEGNTYQDEVSLYAESAAGLSVVTITGSTAGVVGTVNINGAAGWYTGTITHDFAADEVYTLTFSTHTAGVAVYTVSVSALRTRASRPAGILAWGQAFPDDTDYEDGEPISPARYWQLADLAAELWRRAFGAAGTVELIVRKYPAEAERLYVAVPPTPDGRDVDLRLFYVPSAPAPYDPRPLRAVSQRGSVYIPATGGSATLTIPGALEAQAQPQLREVTIDCGSHQPTYGWTDFSTGIVFLEWDSAQTIVAGSEQYLGTDGGDIITTDDGLLLRIGR